jgi:predicted esterase
LLVLGVWFSLAGAPGWCRLSAAEPAATGFLPEVTVSGPTRLDWRFAAAGFGPKAAQLPTSYDSSSQRYQLFVPPSYKPAQSWPLIVFISPGDDPLGWRFWQKPCEDAGVLFCAAYGAGNNCPLGQRVRIVLDVLDDVRRHYRIDPDQTYLAGFSGGGSMACTIAFSLPEYFGGVVPICGTNPLNDLAYLRHRVRDRLPVALLTGAQDFNRRENEEYMQPLMQALGVHNRLWVVPKLGHGVPAPEVLAEAYRWLADDRKRRQDDRRAHPGLAVQPEDVPTPLQQGSRLVEAAEAELREPAHTWDGVALLQGVVARFGRTDAADRARKLLDEIKSDPTRAARVAEQGGAEERLLLTVQAEGLERLGDLPQALQVWRLLLKLHPETLGGKKASAAVGRLEHTAYLGVVFAGDTATVSQVAPKGPAANAGLRPGDVVLRIGGLQVASLAELRRLLQLHAAGEKVELELRRDGKTMTLTVNLGSLPGADERP